MGYENRDCTMLEFWTDEVHGYEQCEENLGKGC